MCIRDRPAYRICGTGLHFPKVRGDRRAEVRRGAGTAHKDAAAILRSAKQKRFTISLEVSSQLREQKNLHFDRRRKNQVECHTTGAKFRDATKNTHTIAHNTRSSNILSRSTLNVAASRRGQAQDGTEDAQALTHDTSCACTCTAKHLAVEKGMTTSAKLALLIALAGRWKKIASEAQSCREP